MGQHAELRQSHEKKIPKLKEDLAVIDQRIAVETRSAADCAEKSSALALEASSGNEKALSQQVKLGKEESEHLQQARNLEKLALPLRQQIAAAEAELPELMISESIEALRTKGPQLKEMSAQITKAIRELSVPLDEYKKEILPFAAQSLTLLGEHADARLLTNIQKGLSEALRAQLHQEFSGSATRCLGQLKEGILIR